MVGCFYTTKDKGFWRFIRYQFFAVLRFCVKEALSQREIDAVEGIFRYFFAISNLSSREHLTLDTFFSSSVRCPIFVNQCIISMAIVSLSDNLGGGHVFFIYL